MKPCYEAAVCAALAVVLALPLAAQAPAKPEEGITRQQADEILNELRQIRQLLEKQQAGPAAPAKDQPERAKLNLQDAPMLGEKDAPITMVEFTDYECPYCQRFHSDTFPEIKKKYIDTGKVRFFSRDFPLDFHPDAMRAAQAGRCARAQGKFWEMRETMNAHPDKLDLESLAAEAGSLKLDIAAFRTCVDDGSQKNGVQTDILEATKIGADGTPAFVIGKSTATGVDGEIMVGAQPFDAFDQKLKALETAQ
ncbi:MAG: thioredoxin domain-containing protein [Bryobacteraceae bacterium]|jgi:protein-disulfide isomerase